MADITCLCELPSSRVACLYHRTVVTAVETSTGASVLYNVPLAAIGTARMAELTADERLTVTVTYSEGM